jgi:hypothetical protein
MLIVRKLALGRISPHASAATLALQLERAMREVRISAVPFDRPGAKDANAVLMASHAEAIAHLARLHALGAEAREWFWSDVVPAWHRGLSAGERWLALFQAGDNLTEGLLVAAMVLKEAVSAGVEDHALSALPPGQGGEWLLLAGGGAPTRSDVDGAELVLNARHSEIIKQWAWRWGPNCERLVWAAMMFAIAEQPARVADSGLAARAAAWVGKGARGGKVVSGRLEIAAELVNNRSLAPDPGEGSPQERRSANLPVEQAQARPVAESELQIESIDGASLVNSPTGSRSRPSAWERWGDPSDFAGLLFIVPILQRLGFAEALCSEPFLLDIGFPVRLMRFIAKQVRARSDDPILSGFEDYNPSASLPAARTIPEPVREILMFPAPRASLDSLLLLWLTAIRRWSRRHARMGLVSLTRRPGSVARSRTHLDITFDLRKADVRLRRLALDVDPGWVPWLGCVVRFHYLDADEH